MFSILTTLSFLGCSPEPTEQSEPYVRVAPDVGPQALEDRSHLTGSNSLAEVGGKLFTVNTDAGTVTRLDPESNELTELDVGAEPSRITSAGNALYVTLRGERAIVKLDATRFDRIEARYEVGAEPLGVVAREDGERVYVAVSQADRIVELTADLVEMSHFRVDGEPRSLALHPSGVRLFIGLGQGDAGLASLDLITRQVDTIAMPPTTRGDIDLTGRVSGDITITPDGARVVVPVLYLDTVSPIPAMESPEEVVELPPNAASPYGGRSEEVGRANPSIVEFDVDAQGAVTSDGRALFISASRFDGTLNFPVQRSAVSYITSVVTAPDGLGYLASMESAGVAVLIAPNIEVISQSPNVFGVPFDSDIDGFQEGAIVVPSENGFFVPATAAMEAGSGVNGAIFANGGAFTNNGFSGTVSFLPLAAAQGRIQTAASTQFNRPGVIDAVALRQASVSPLSQQIQQGRHLFYSSQNASMGAGGISCSTCHVDGRTDGITWSFEDGPRQTPSLAGRVSDTAPVTWRSNVQSVRDEIDITTRGRMGGSGLTVSQLDAVEAYVDWSRLPDTPRQGRSDLDIQHGRELFEQAGCGVCHVGSTYTNNDSITMRGVDRLNTPTLQGIAATAPYMHDGSAATLRDVLLLGRDGTMGETAQLTEFELRDLEAYLLSL